MNTYILKFIHKYSAKLNSWSWTMLYGKRNNESRS